MTIDTSPLLPCVEIEPRTLPTHAVIWLHGLGADGNDFVSIIPELHLPDTLGMRFIFPHAPEIPVTINGGIHMPAWYDIYGANIAAKIDTTGIQRSVSQLHRLIAQQEALGVPSEHIVLAGFSQGGVIALAAGLSYPKRLAGIMALSSYLPMADNTIATAAPCQQHLPIFVAHGKEDTVVPVTLGLATQQALGQAGYQVAWHSYRMAHSVCAEEVQDISEWLTITNPQ